jgi:ABC-type glycerol-3-phosphate transport system permease component
VFGSALMIVYAAITLFPFYALFVRTFVGTKDSTDLHLWIPQTEDISLDAQVGNLAVFYNLDLRKVKADLGIPSTTFLSARTTLQQVSEKYKIPPERIKDYFAGFYTYNGWMTLLSGTAFWYALARTLLITAASLIGLTVLSVCTGYGLAGLKRRGQMIIYNTYLLQMVIPGMLIILPQFMVVQGLLRLFPGYDSPGVIRSTLQLVALILLNVKGGAASTMIMTSFISAIPKEIEEAAQLDGASQLQYIIYVLFPLLKMPIASLVVIMLPQFWNQFLEPFVYLDQNNTTLLPMIQNLSGVYSTNFQILYTAIFVSVVPLVVVYMVFRRFFVQGAMAGALKG